MKKIAFVLGLLMMSSVASADLRLNVTTNEGRSFSLFSSDLTDSVMTINQAGNFFISAKGQNVEISMEALKKMNLNHIDLVNVIKSNMNDNGLIELLISYREADKNLIVRFDSGQQATGYR